MQNINEYRILFIEDDLEYADHLRSLLAQQTTHAFISEQAASFDDAISQLQENHYDAILLDFQLADLRDQPNLNIIRDLADNSHDTALIGLIDSADEELARMAVKYGLQDRLIKNAFDEHMIINKLLFAIRRANEGLTSRSNEDFLASEYLFDSRTGLPNQILFNDRLSESIKRSNRNELSTALVVINFKYFNVVDTYFGNAIGNEILSKIKKVLLHNTRDSDTISHTSDDTFMIILENLEKVSYVSLLAERIIRRFSQAVHVNGHDFKMTASAGIALYPSSSERDLLAHAQQAMHRALEMGGNRYKIYSADFNREAIWRYRLEDDLQQALALHQLKLHYQPLYDLKEQRVYGVEALLRWDHPQQGLLLPDAFIDELEQTDTILEIGSWVFDEACRQLSSLQSKYPYLSMNINITARQLDDPYLIERITCALEKHSIQPRFIEFEITERQIIDYQNSINQYNIQRLSNMGIRIALDDFGVACNTESYFNYFPENSIATIKIDRFDTQSLLKDASISQRIENYVKFSKDKKIRVIAEGIENNEQLQHFENLGVHLVQGYLISKPVSSSQLEDGLQCGEYKIKDNTASNEDVLELVFS